MSNGLAVITGASSGIGYNLARVFAEQGYDLVIGSAGERLQSAEQDFKKLDVNLTAVQADLATYDGVEEFWNAVEKLGRPVDAAAINAGIGLGGLFAETDLEREIKIVRLNVEGTVHVAKRAVQHMARRGKGRILITSSIAGELVAPREAVYAASKAFDLSFAKSIREELKDTGVTVTALEPSATDTDFFRRAGMENTQMAESKKENSPYEVARQAFDALMRGEQHVYAGTWKVKVEGEAVGLTPDKLQAIMHEKQAHPKDKEAA